MSRPFSAQASTISLAVTATASVAVQLPVKANALRIVNEGPNTAFIAISQSAAVLAVVPGTSATQTSTPILAGADVTLSMENGALPNYISAICRAGGTAVLDLSPGEGV